MTTAGIVVVGLVSLNRCGGFFGESHAVPGTLSEHLCRDPAGRVLFAVNVIGPLALGLLGTVRAARTGDIRALGAALLAAAAIPIALGILYLISGSL